MELHTDKRWRKEGREVLKGSVPVRKVKGLYNDAEKQAPLHGIWQTKPWRLELTKDGKIPMNEYGNIEIFNGPLPETTCHLHVPRMMQICKKLEVEAVPSVTRFDKLSNGMSVPVIEGAVIFEKDKAAVLEESRQMLIKSEENLRKKVVKEAK